MTKVSCGPTSQQRQGYSTTSQYVESAPVSAELRCSVITYSLLELVLHLGLLLEFLELVVRLSTQLLSRSITHTPRELLLQPLRYGFGLGLGLEFVITVP